jgi:hypothetical protein
VSTSGPGPLSEKACCINFTPSNEFWCFGEFSDPVLDVAQRSEHGKVVLAQQELFLDLAGRCDGEAARQVARPQRAELRRP